MAVDVLDYQPSSTNTKTGGAVRKVTDQNVFQLVNRTSQAIDYVFEATYAGDDFSDAVQIGSGTVSANSVAQQTLDYPWDKIRVKATPQTAPGGSSSFIVKEHVED